jgi:dihydroorotate dehydrogenase electron transfer subunit
VNAPFARRHSVVDERVELGRYVVLVITDPLARARPGQFYMLAAAKRWGGGDGERPFLARAISIMRAGADGAVEFLLEDVGPGTKSLCELAAGDQVTLLGPLGNGFEPCEPDSLLVGGGIGVAPLLGVQEAWGGDALLGFRDALHAQAATRFRDPAIATDDGSLGHHGFVTDLLDMELAINPRPIYACGPPAMLHAIKDRARRYGVAAQLAVEAPMACGFGACYGCVVATADGYKRVCLDGPVFESAVLA